MRAPDVLVPATMRSQVYEEAVGQQPNTGKSSTLDNGGQTGVPTARENRNEISSRKRHYDAEDTTNDSNGKRHKSHIDGSEVTARKRQHATGDTTDDCDPKRRKLNMNGNMETALGTETYPQSASVPNNAENLDTLLTSKPGKVKNNYTLGQSVYDRLLKPLLGKPAAPNSASSATTQGEAIANTCYIPKGQPPRDHANPIVYPLRAAQALQLAQENPGQQYAFDFNKSQFIEPPTAQETNSSEVADPCVPMSAMGYDESTGHYWMDVASLKALIQTQTKKLERDMEDWDKASDDGELDSNLNIPEDFSWIKEKSLLRLTEEEDTPLDHRKKYGIKTEDGNDNERAAEPIVVEDDSTYGSANYNNGGGLDESGETIAAVYDDIYSLGLTSSHKGVEPQGHREHTTAENDCTHSFINSYGPTSHNNGGSKGHKEPTTVEYENTSEVTSHYSGWNFGAPITVPMLPSNVNTNCIESTYSRTYAVGPNTTNIENTSLSESEAV
ncbi:hypothetical protein DRE_02816 [Drechslerella stenobrocha 248]|uniref:Uncharacterized protein n=1 Tax=Drechslerella stenobrocha 248 TaxID=1043628 RepID=W7HWK6_9PEZI|nr:hypothetical protein DRE_02816 [Drechslerella stenobrocha 248]